MTQIINVGKHRINLSDLGDLLNDENKSFILFPHRKYQQIRVNHRGKVILYGDLRGIKTSPEDFAIHVLENKSLGGLVTNLFLNIKGLQLSGHIPVVNNCWNGVKIYTPGIPFNSENPILNNCTPAIIKSLKRKGYVIEN